MFSPQKACMCVVLISEQKAITFVYGTKPCFFFFNPVKLCLLRVTKCIFKPFGAGIIFLILAHPVYKM